MKKRKYSVPDVYYESFELSRNIAALCSNRITNQADYYCPIWDSELGFSIFAEDNPACDVAPQPGEDNPCFSVPLADTNVYNS